MQVSTTIGGLFRDVFDLHLIRHSVPRANVAEYMAILKYCFGHLSKGQLPYEIPFDDLHYCLAYLQRYALCHSVMVRRAMVRLLDSGTAEVEAVFSGRSSLEIVSLGGGPGNDLVGLLSALTPGRFSRLTTLQVCVVDKNKGWESLFRENMDLLEKGEYGDPSRLFREVSIISDFQLSDIKAPNSGMVEKMRNADIVLLVKVFSNIPDSEKARVLKGIVKLMKKNALLFFIDCHIEAFSSLKHELLLVYELHKKRYSLKPRQTNFDCAVNKNCVAKVQVFKKTN